jgi:agmatinase
VKGKLETYLEADTGSYGSGDWVIVGAPLEETACYGKGMSGGPAAIREASDCLEDYCPIADRSLHDISVVDIGDIPVDVVPFPKNLEFIRNAIDKIVNKRARPLLLGGEHTVTLPAVEAVLQKNFDLCLIHLDAHADLRDDYEGDTFSHACVVKRIADLLGPERIFQAGIRSGTREEWGWIRMHQSLYSCRPQGLDKLIAKVGERPVYVTLDLDILDPSVLPGTGTPEPGGISYQGLDQIVRKLGSLRVVGADVVELAPALDSSGVSSVTASKIVRTMLLSL